MADRSKLIDMYIAGIVKKLKPKNEEIIHSGVFLACSGDETVGISDWYHNGFSVISETVTHHVHELCKRKEVEFSSKGRYSFVSGKKEFSSNILPEITKKLDSKLSSYDSNLQLLDEASSLFREKSGSFA